MLSCWRIKSAYYEKKILTRIIMLNNITEYVLRDNSNKTVGLLNILTMYSAPMATKRYVDVTRFVRKWYNNTRAIFAIIPVKYCEEPIVARRGGVEITSYNITHTSVSNKY